MYNTACQFRERNVTDRRKIIYNKRKEFRLETGMIKSPTERYFPRYVLDTNTNHHMWLAPYYDRNYFPFTNFFSGPKNGNVLVFPDKLLQLLRCDTGCAGVGVVMEKNHALCDCVRWGVSVSCLPSGLSALYSIDLDSVLLWGAVTQGEKCPILPNTSSSLRAQSSSVARSDLI